MIISSTSENKEIEKRVAITPEITKKYINLGFQIQLIKNYGKHIGFEDSHFKDAGAKIINDEEVTLEMYVMQLLHLKGIKAPLTDETNEAATSLSHKEKKITKEEENYKENNTPKTKSQLKNTDQIKTNLMERPKSTNEKSIKAKINSFEDIVKLANQENEIELKYDLERNVKLVNFRNGTIDISFNEKLNKNFIKILTEKLFSWTGERWIISLSKNLNAKSVFEKSLEQKNIKIEEFQKSKINKEIRAAFPDAKLIDIEEIE